MELEIFPHEDNDDELVVSDALRVEITQEANDGQQYKIILLDADDSFDVVVHFPNSEREIVWSLIRERPGQ